MGVGLFEQMTYAVEQGVDMFDCVLPTRIARNGSVMTRRGRYPLKSAVYAEDDGSIDEECDSYASRTFTRAYIRHLIQADEILALRLITEHNLTVYKMFMDEMRESILNDEFASFRDEFMSNYTRVRKDHVALIQKESRS